MHGDRRLIHMEMQTLNQDFTVLTPVWGGRAANFPVF